MDPLLLNLYIATALFTPPAILAIWFFGLRRYLHKNGRPAITAVTWGFSMWADWTEALDVGWKKRKVPFSVLAFAGIHLLIIAEIILGLVAL